MKDRVCYFSNDDLSLGYYLELAEKRILEISEGEVPTDLSDIIELWHIMRMMEEGCRLAKWTDAHFKELRALTMGYKIYIVKFFNSLNPDKIKYEYELLEWTYKKTFWEIIKVYKLYALIKPDVLVEIANNNINDLCDILACQGIVENFKTELRDVLIGNPNCAHLLLEEYTRKDNSLDRKLYFPSNLTLDDKEQIINSYLDGDNLNVNYVRLVLQVKDNPQKIVLSPRLRLKAEKLVKKLNEDLMKDPRTAMIRWSMKVQFIDQDGLYPKELFIDENGEPTYTYSIPYIRNCDNITRVKNCISLFEWMNGHFLLNLVNKMSEVDPMERTIIGERCCFYPTFLYFNQKNHLALFQLYGYEDVLKNLGSSFEMELKSFYENHLQKDYGYPSLSLNIPQLNDSFLNKCRIICPELDAVVKQYNTYVEYDEINRDIIRLSKPLPLEEGKSLLTNKYYEIEDGNAEFVSILRGLFGSNNSLLSYVEPFQNKNYPSLIDLLKNEDGVLYENYREYQKPYLNLLIKNNLIAINSGGELFVVDARKIEVLRCIWEFGVCSYWHYDETERLFLDEMLAKGWLKTDCHLLSSPERDYFSFYLDNAKFTNGMAYRNHYAHGSTPSADDENEHSKAYRAFLMLLAIIILKIEDDLWLAEKVKAIHSRG